MILLYDKKKGYKNILKDFGPLILSFHIHFIAFIVFFTYQQKNQEISLNQNNKKNVLHVKIMKNFDNSEEKSFKNKIKSTKVIKNKFHTISQSHQKKMEILNQNNNTILSKKIENDFSLANETVSIHDKLPEPLNEEVVMNPFGNLKLPKSLLGQNLFPKKYKAHFKISYKNGKTHNFELIELYPEKEGSSFLDKSVKKSFENQIFNLPKEAFLQWLDHIREINYPSAQNQNPNGDNLFIVLEFQEPN
ncbi:MAG: hypothetical protein K2X69_12115 [Silvanigrellaceae bacterium]|nr:hypothetical protein [Silvanigrellaceae bacterium]